MIVWMPYSNMRLSVHVIDSQLLGTQIGECLKILSILCDRMNGGSSRYHNTVLSWSDHPEALMLYTDYALREMHLRGHDLKLPSPLTKEGCKLYDFPKEWIQKNPRLPEWIGIISIHASHRAALLAADKSWYSQFAWDEVPRTAFNWPAKMPRVGDSVIDRDGNVFIVQSYDDEKRLVLYRKGAELAFATRVDIYKGIWKRCIVLEES